MGGKELYTWWICSGSEAPESIYVLKGKWRENDVSYEQQPSRKMLQRSAEQQLLSFLFFLLFKSTVALLQVNEIWWVIHVICLCCIGNSHCVVIEKWAPSTVSYQTACRMFKYAVPVCCRNIQFEVSLLLMNILSTLWPLAHSGEKTIKTWAIYSDCCLVLMCHMFVMWNT